jgi:4'-phosphopantetheinyl transferase
MIISNQKTITWSTIRSTNTKVHIWHASLEQPEAVLSEDERQRAERFRYQEHRHSFIISRGILRNLLYRYTGIQPD